MSLPDSAWLRHAAIALRSHLTLLTLLAVLTLLRLLLLLALLLLLLLRFLPKLAKLLLRFEPILAHMHRKLPNPNHRRTSELAQSRGRVLQHHEE